MVYRGGRTVERGVPGRALRWAGARSRHAHRCGSVRARSARVPLAGSLVGGVVRRLDPRRARGPLLGAAPESPSCHQALAPVAGRARRPTQNPVPLEVPFPHRPFPSGGGGRYWTIEGGLYHDYDEPRELAMAYFRDVRRRCRVGRLAAERGLPAELVARAWAALPYESVPFRFGWDCWRALRGPTSPPRSWPARTPAGRVIGRRGGAEGGNPHRSAARAQRAPRSRAIAHPADEARMMACPDKRWPTAGAVFARRGGSGPLPRVPTRRECRASVPRPRRAARRRAMSARSERPACQIAWLQVTASTWGRRSVSSHRRSSSSSPLRRDRGYRVPRPMCRCDTNGSWT
jgi:hypothetical protein